VKQTQRGPRGLRLIALGNASGDFHRWLAPTTEGRRRLLNPAADRAEQGVVLLPGRSTLTTALADSAALAALLDEGHVVLMGPSGRTPSRG